MREFNYALTPLPAFDQSALFAAAGAYYKREDEFVDVDYMSAAAGSVTRLPFVNRVEQLCDAARELIHNVSLVRTSPASDSRMLKLVFCSQLFGAGKTSLLKRVAAGLNAAYGGRQSYVRFEGVSVGDPATVDSAIVRMVIDAAEQGKVIAPEDAARLRRPGFCVLSSVLLFVQKRLAANDMVPGTVSRLFLHLDEFDLSNINVLKLFRASAEQHTY